MGTQGRQAIAESTKVPANVLGHVERSIRWMREIRERLDQTILRLDVGLGGGGRYEADGLTNSAKDIASAMCTIQQFREYAPANGVDAERVLEELGGLPDFTPSEAAVEWLSRRPAPRRAHNISSV